MYFLFFYFAYTFHVLQSLNFSCFLSIKIRYYDFKLDTQYDEEDIVTVEKDSYTQDMHFFISQIKNVITIKEADQVKIQLLRTLKKIALK